MTTIVFAIFYKVHCILTNNDQNTQETAMKLENNVYNLV